MDITKLLGLKVAGPKDRARISEVTGNFVSLDEFAENWNGFSNTGKVTAAGTDFSIEPALKIATELFSLTLKMPRAYAEDDTITVDGVAYSLYQGTDPALSEAWKAGEVVTINFDKVSRRCWASAGGGAPRPLPPQVGNMQASTPEGETPSIVWSWTNPVDDNFAGMVLIVKEGSAPNGVTDGTQVYKGTGTTFTQSEGVQWEHTYFARGFAYNSQNKFQMDASGAIASATPSDVPDRVSDVTLTGNKGSMTLTWTNPTQQSFDLVKVIQKIDSDPESPTDGTEVYSGTDTTVTVSGLQDSINYHFAIFAMGKNGKYKAPVVKTYTPAIWPKYDYTGNHTLVKDNAEQGWWRIKFLSSGVLTWLDEDKEIDVFLVGGGANAGKLGGGGGYTKTVKNQNLKKFSETRIEIGAGAIQGSTANSGGVTIFGIHTVNGGMKNANGGSGGSAYADLRFVFGNAYSGDGGSDGNDGANGELSQNQDTTLVIKGGEGQKTTTREFGELSEELYSGGGSGYALARIGYSVSGGKGGLGTPIIATGGGTSYSNCIVGKPGGGYGGGAGGGETIGGAGAQGIVIIRDARA